tara:strand:+ start:1123 stop:1494 length:372 start_codon:yes stop_codon:yes gene_type:complete
MGTELVTHRSNEVVGKRYWGGDKKGTTLSLDLTKAEYENYKNVVVGYEHSNVYESLEQLVNNWVSQGKTLELQTPTSLNERARDLENHRWYNSHDVGNNHLQPHATELRQRAKVATKDSLQVL